MDVSAVHAGDVACAAVAEVLARFAGMSLSQQRQSSEEERNSGAADAPVTAMSEKAFLAAALNVAYQVADMRARCLAEASEIESAVDEAFAAIASAQAARIVAIESRLALLPRTRAQSDSSDVRSHERKLCA